MKFLFSFFALFALTISPITFAQEGDELDDLIIDDFGDELLLPDEPTFEDPAADPILDPSEEAILDPFEEEPLLEEFEPVAQEPSFDFIDPAVEPTEENFQSSAGISGALPSSASATFTVKNVSQDNADAESVGARPGDVLRYELRIASDVEDVKDYVASIDVSNVLVALDFTDTGLGVLENGRITYPAYSNAAPCEQVFTFFAQLKPDCGDLRSLSITAEGDATSVGTSCELSHTGPAQRFFLLAGIAILMISLVLGMSWGRKTT